MESPYILLMIVILIIPAVVTRRVGASVSS
jgi:hypothetical protein